MSKTARAPVSVENVPHGYQIAGTGVLVTSPEGWWGRLSGLTQQILAEVPDDPVPNNLLAEVTRAGRIALPRAACEAETPAGPFYLPDDVQHWIREEFGPMNDDVWVFEGKAYPLISTRQNGDRLIGYPNTQSAADLYAAGAPPVHGLNPKAVKTSHVAAIRIGSVIGVKRRDRHWVASDHNDEELGLLQWRSSEEGKPYGATGNIIRFPNAAKCRVKRLVVNQDGFVVNFAGMLLPA